MKNHILSGFKYSILYILLLCSIVLLEDKIKGRSIEIVDMLFGFGFLLIIFFISISYLSYLLKLHIAMKRKGCKRFLFVLFILATPAAIYKFYEIMGSIQDVADYFFIMSCATGAAYGVASSIFFGGRWIIYSFRNPHTH
jgi:hypothetical protein